MSNAQPLDEELLDISSDDDFSCWDELKKKFWKWVKKLCCFWHTIRERNRESFFSKHRLKLILVFLILTIAISLVFCFMWQDRYKDNMILQQKKRNLQLDLSMTMHQRQDRKTRKVLEFNGLRINKILLNLEDYPQTENKTTNKIIHMLNLTGNGLTALSNFNVPGLETLILTSNPLQKFQSNYLISLKQLILPDPDSTSITESLYKFSYNTFQEISQLNLKQYQYLIEVTGNKFRNLKRLRLPDMVEYFSCNVIEELEGFQIVGMERLRKMENNTLKLERLELKSPGLEVFKGNRFKGLERIVIEESNFVQFETRQHQELREVLIGPANTITQMVIIDNVNLQNVVYSGKSLENVTIVNSNISHFPYRQFNTGSIKYLLLKQNNLKSCKLEDTNELLTLHIDDSSLETLTFPTTLILQNLTLENTKVAQISNFYLPQLTSITLINNTQLKIFNNNCFDNLQQIVIKNSNIIEFENNSFKNVKRIVLEDKKITNSFLEQINKQSVQQIVLIGNNLQYYNFNQFVNLRSLTVANNPIVNLQLSGLKKLINLNLNLTQLQTLDLHNTSVSDLTNINFESVIELKIQRSPILSFQNISSKAMTSVTLHNLPGKVFGNNNLPALEVVYIKNTSLGSISLGDNSSLRRLRLENTKIKSINLNEHKLGGLHRLVLINNSLLQQINYPQLPLLKVLQLQNNTKLDKILLRNNLLDSLIGMTLNITVLQITDNPTFSMLENNIFPKLKYLRLENVNLKDILGNEMKSLTDVYLKDIRLGKIPYLGKSVQNIEVHNISLKQLVIPNQYKYPLHITLYAQHLNYIILENLQNVKYFQFHLRQLQHILIVNSSVSQINFGTSLNIKTLWLQNTMIQNFADIKLISLEELYLIGNNTESVVNNNFPHLQILEIIGNVGEFNMIISPQLKKMSIKNTGLYKLPSSSKFPNIESIIIKDNPILGALELVNLDKLQEIEIDGSFFRLLIQNTTLTSLSNLNLTDLDNLTLINNTRLFQIANCDFNDLTTLQLEDTKIMIIMNSFFHNVTQLFLGIGYYPSVETLYIPQKIEKMVLYDVPGQQFIRNQIYPNLKQLILDYLDLGQTLEIKNFKKLEYLKINNLIGITEIIVENIPLSNKLVVNGNHVTQLNVTNSQLTTLELDVANMVQFSLKNTSVKSMKYISNSLKRFSLSESPIEKLELLSRSLEYVDVNLTEVTEIIINAPLSRFQHYLPMIEKLYLKNTKLDELRITKSPELSQLLFETSLQQLSLELSNTKVESFEKSKFNYLKQLIIRNTPISTIPKHSQSRLTHLQLNNCNDLKYTILENLNSIESVKLFNIIIDDITIRNNKLKQVQLNLPLLNSLSLQSNQLQLNMSKINIPNIVKLSLFDIDTGKWISPISQYLVDLSIKNCTVDFISLQQNIKLKNLYISDNKYLTYVKIFLDPSGTHHSDPTQDSHIFISSNNIKQLYLQNYNNNNLQIFKETKIQTLSLINSLIDSVVIRGFALIQSIYIKNCANVKSLVLPKNSNLKVLSLKKLPQLKIVSLQNCENIQTMILQNTPYININSYNFPFLKQMFIEDTSITDINLFYIPSLKLLNIKSNPLKSIQNKYLTQLETLYIKDTILQSLGKNTRFETLDKLFVFSSTIMDITYSNLNSVSNVQIKDSKISTIVNQTFSKLISMRIDSKSLSAFKGNTFPNLLQLQLTNAQSLQQFNIGENCNKIQILRVFNLTIPFSFNSSTYPQLSTLDVSGSSIRQLTISQSIKYLKIDQIDAEKNENFTKINFVGKQSITNLELYHTSIRKFSDFNLPSLKELVLIENTFLQKFQNNTFQSLVSLHISNSTLTDFSNNSYPNLYTLTLSYNKIQSFHNNILPNLQNLLLSNNLLSTYNQSFDSLINLDLRYNQFSSIPLNFFHLLPNIEKLQIANNKLTSLTGYTSKSLQQLNLRNSNLLQLNNNSFSSLTTLDLSDQNITMLNNNKFPSLSTLYMINNVNMPGYLLLAALAGFKNQGVEMKELNFQGVELDEDVKVAIKAINGKADIKY